MFSISSLAPPNGHASNISNLLMSREANFKSVKLFFFLTISFNISFGSSKELSKNKEPYCSHILSNLSFNSDKTLFFNWQVPRRYWKHWALGPRYQDFPRDKVNINAWKACLTKVLSDVFLVFIFFSWWDREDLNKSRSLLACQGNVTKWRFADGPIMAQHWMLAWFVRGSGPILLRNAVFCHFFRGGGGGGGQDPLFSPPPPTLDWCMCWHISWPSRVTELHKQMTMHGYKTVLVNEDK